MSAVLNITRASLAAMPKGTDLVYHYRGEAIVHDGDLVIEPNLGLVTFSGNVIVRNGDVRCGVGSGIQVGGNLWVDRTVESDLAVIVAGDIQVGMDLITNHGTIDCNGDVIVGNALQSAENLYVIFTVRATDICVNGQIAAERVRAIGDIECGSLKEGTNVAYGGELHCPAGE